MAISSMTKILIACHKSQASQLLESLQQSGICQILNAEEAMVSKHYPDLATAGERPRHLEEKLNLVSKSVAFLRHYANTPKGLTAALAPRVVIDKRHYDSVIKDKTVDELIKSSLEVETAIEKLNGEIENIQNTLVRLQPWSALHIDVEELTGLEKTTCFAGLLPVNKLDNVTEALSKTDAAIEHVGSADTQVAVLVVSLKDKDSEVQKLLRSADFESVSFEGMAGTVTELIDENNKKLAQTQAALERQQAKAKELARDFVKLEILHDYYLNLLNREQTASDCPATERTIILEGWVRKKNLVQLEEIVARFEAAQVSQIEPSEGEEIPVEIENRRLVRPFEVVTRLYGMPQYFNLDPTVFFAPFFTVFFALCLADTGYGLLMVGITAWLVVKMQGDKKLLYMLGICGVSTAIFGAMTGGWLGDIIQQFIPALEPLRQKLMLFDPLADPRPFLILALGLGYFQINVGIAIALGHDIKQRNFLAAICDRLTWLVMLNSILIFGLGKFGLINGQFSGVFGKIAIIPAIMIFLFSHREGSIGARLGMGFYNVFSTIFFLGDVLSYLRLMALGMVGAGLAMAVNIIAKIALKAPYGIGIILMILILAGGHLFNLAMSALGAFVHTLRLQYVEFFPKFLVGGGRNFEPLAKQFKYIHVISDKSRAISEK